MNYGKLQFEVGRDDWQRSLSGLWRFRGPVTPHAMRARYLGVYAMFLAEVETFAAGRKLLSAQDLHHVCGMHTAPVKGGLVSMVSRIRQTPEIENRFVGFRDWLEWICPHPYKLHVNQYAGATPRDQVLQYPFIQGKPRDDHTMLLRVHKLIPKWLDADFRGEICQDIFVDLLSGKVSEDNLPDHIRSYVKRAYKNVPDGKFNTLSLDEVINEETGYSRGEWLDSSRSFRKWTEQQVEEENGSEEDGHSGEGCCGEAVA